MQAGHMPKKSSKQAWQNLEDQKDGLESVLSRLHRSPDGQSVRLSVSQSSGDTDWTSRSWRYDAWKYSCCCTEKKEKKTFIDPMGNLQKGERTVAQRWKNPSLPATHLDKSRC